MKKLIVGLVFLSLILTNLSLSPAIAAEKNDVVIVFEDAGRDDEPINFRDLNDIGIPAIASAQFSERQLDWVVGRYKQHLKDIIVVDLREESHGFTDGRPFMWFGEFNAANSELENNNVLDKEGRAISSIKSLDTLNLKIILEKDYKNGWFKKSADITFKNPVIKSEKDVVESAGLKYYRIPVTDHKYPTKEDEERIVNFMKSLPKNSLLYVHCLGGHGRTTTFLAMYDMILHPNLSLDDILTRQKNKRGSDLANLKEDGKMAVKSKKQRLAFIKEFYDKNSSTSNQQR